MAIQDELELLSAHPAWVPVSDLDVIQLEGADRERFLNGFCTNDVLKLDVPGCREAFVLNDKGKTVGHLWIIKLPDRLLMVTPRGHAHDVIQHLDRYLIREDVTISDVSGQWAQWFLLGTGAEGQIPEALDANEAMSQVTDSARTGWPAHPQAIWARAELAGPGWLLMAPSADTEAIETWLGQTDWPQVSADAMDVWRVQSRTPRFGRDITVENLPQEVARDDTAICFDKGCYLGQETVARIDSLGRVNRLLRVLCIDRPEPMAPGEKIEVDGRVVGTITSIVWHPIRNAWLALAYVRRDRADAGTEIAPNIHVV